MPDKDKKLKDLLKKSDSGGEYPPHLKSARREMFIAKIFRAILNMITGRNSRNGKK